MSRLQPLLVFGSEDYALATHLLAAIDLRLLGRPIGSLAQARDTIMAVIDVLLAGV